MSVRTTAILLFLFAIIGGYVYNNVLNKPKATATPRPFVYQYEMTDIVRMTVETGGSSLDVALDQEKDEWKFTDESRGKVDAGRLNGIRLLLSGPGANRLLLQELPTPEQLADYGFNKPQVIATITLKDGKVHRVLIGELTPDGRNYYIKNVDGPSVYLVDYTWGNEMKRFVSEPPVAKEEAGA